MRDPVVNDPFCEGAVMEYDDEFDRISLDDVKSDYIPHVTYMEFFEWMNKNNVPMYLQNVYYLHYLCIIGDLKRFKNFILDLKNQEIDIEAIVNFNRLKEFNYGSCCHTATLWNTDTEFLVYLRVKCDANFAILNGFYDEVYCMNIEYVVYTNPFENLIGNIYPFTNRPNKILDVYNPVCRDIIEFSLIINYTNTIRDEFEVESESESEHEEEEHEEEIERVEVEESEHEEEESEH